MIKNSFISMGVNLGFIEEIVLTDGTVLENGQVLYRAPIPNKEQLEEIFFYANIMASDVFEPAAPNWSLNPALMRNSHLFNNGSVDSTSKTADGNVSASSSSRLINK